jgi:hypothetical protein
MHMFKFLSRSSDRRSASIRQALVKAGLSAAADPAKVTVVERKGNYSGRPVRYFRAFEPEHEELLLRSGFVEREGGVVVNRQP